MTYVSCILDFIYNAESNLTSDAFVVEIKLWLLKLSESSPKTKLHHLPKF